MPTDVAAKNLRRTMAKLPETWSWATVDDVTLPIEKVDPSMQPDLSFKYLDISSIDNSSNRVVDVKVKSYVGRDAPSRARQLIQTSDVLLSTVRTYLKNIAKVPSTYDGQIASTGFSVLRAANEIAPDLLFHYSLTNDFLNRLSKLQRGTSYPAVRDMDVRIQHIPVPPKHEQHRIVDRL